MRWLAEDVHVNLGVLTLVLGGLITVIIGVLAWSIKKLIDATVIEARMTEQLDDLERRIANNEQDIRLLSDRFLPGTSRFPSGKNRPSPGI